MCFGNANHILKWFSVLWLLIGFSILTFGAKVLMTKPILLMMIATWMSIGVGFLYLMDFMVSALQGGLCQGFMDEDED